MYRNLRYHPHSHPHLPQPMPHGGLLGIFGGVVGLTTASLQGGVRIIRHVVEGTLWHGDYHGGCGCHCGHPHHIYHYECRPHYHGHCGC